MSTQLVEAEKALAAHRWKMSEQLSESELLPDHYRGKPENVFLGLCTAERLGVDPQWLLQSSHVIHGNVGFKSEFIRGLANGSGRFKGPIRFQVEEESSDGMRARAYAIESISEDVLEGPWASMAMAKSEGWTKNDKYTSMPGIMLRYRASDFFVRLYCPEVLGGQHTVQELEDIHPEARQATVVDSKTPEWFTDVQAEVTDAKPEPEPTPEPKAEMPGEDATDAEDKAWWESGAGKEE